ncbi:MAG: lipoprotein [Alphaproteobacteria bacterium]|nr:lipoprotein [Alphaproteobacteria bacterium]
MKKVILLFVFSAMVALTACGVKSDLEHPNGANFPRNYPVE